jgi:hypothetical protein
VKLKGAITPVGLLETGESNSVGIKLEDGEGE